MSDIDDVVPEGDDDQEASPTMPPASSDEPPVHNDQAVETVSDDQDSEVSEADQSDQANLTDQADQDTQDLQAAQDTQDLQANQETQDLKDAQSAETTQDLSEDDSWQEDSGFDVIVNDGSDGAQHQMGDALQNQGDFPYNGDNQESDESGWDANLNDGPVRYQSAYQAAYSNPAVEPASAYGVASSSPSHKEPERKRRSGVRTFFLAFLGALVACIIAFLVAYALGLFSSPSSSSSSTTIGSTSNTSIDAEEEDASLAEAVAAKALPSVANIDVYSSYSSSGLESLFGYGYGYGDESDSDSLTQASLGSGVVLSEDGYVITNYHVIEDSEALKVTIEGESYDAEVVGYDSSSDIAVIKAVDASDLTPIEIGDSDNLTIGEWVMSIGSPFGLEQSVATGIISATSRSQIMDSSTGSDEVTIYPNMIQTDAAINPGNSGGALVDSDGKLIGINTLITSYSGNYSGVGFAIPVNYAISLAEQIINGETPTHAQLGVSLTTIDASTAERYGFSVDTGAYVNAVNEGSGAEAAGIEVGDIITAFDGEKVESASDLMLDVRTDNPGDVVTVTVNRDGESLDLEVTLGSDESSQTEESQQSGSSSSSPYGNMFGDGNGSGSGSGGYGYGYGGSNW